MTRVALRGIRSHLGRFLLSILAVLLGVGFVAGTFSLRAMMSATFDDIVNSGTNADTYVQGAKIEATGGGAMGGFAGAEQFPIAMADVIAEADGVAGVVPDVSGSIVLVGADGTAVMSSGPPSFGMGLDPDETAIWMADGRRDHGRPGHGDRHGGLRAGRDGRPGRGLRRGRREPDRARDVGQGHPRGRARHGRRGD